MKEIKHLSIKLWISLVSIIVFLGLCYFAGGRFLSMPGSPELNYSNLGSDQWEFKRLRIDGNGLAIWDKQGTVMFKNNMFELIVNSPERAEEDKEYLKKTIWWDIDNQLIKAKENQNYPLGFLEYYGFYYLVLQSEGIPTLVCLGETKTFNGTMSVNDFYKKAWSFFQKYKGNIYGGTGLL